MFNKELLLQSEKIKVWENPKISGVGTIGSSNFAVDCTGDSRYGWSGNEIWRAFDKNTSTEYFNRCGSGAKEDYLTITMYANKPIRLTNITITQTGYGFGSGILQYSDNGSSWKDIKTVKNGSNAISLTTFHRYWRIRKAAYGNNSGGWRNINISEIYLRGFQQL